MRLSFPAMEGLMGGRTYHACLMKLSAIPKMFTFTDWEEFTPEQREQRVLNKKRVPEIARYILENEEGFLFSSITASYKCPVHFVPQADGQRIGQLEIDFEEANFVINDGQHRCAAIAQALKMNPSLGDHSISVLLFPYENLDRVQQMFSDLNRFVVKTSKSLDILYDKRDPISRVVNELCEKIGAFKTMVDKDAVSLPARSPKLFTLSSLYDATHELLDGQELTPGDQVSRAIEFWTCASKLIPDWSRVKKGDLKAVELRQESICAHSVVLRALGSIGGELMRSSSREWKERLGPLATIDWRKVNPDWENVCIIANSVVSNRQARLATKAYLKRKLALELNDPEQRALHPVSSGAAGASGHPD